MRFNVWRGEIAKAAGIPLFLMDGFVSEDDNPFKVLLLGVPDDFQSRFKREVWEYLPISWDILKPDPLHILLHHSDCDGIIEAKDCLPIAERLEQLIPLLPDENSHFRTDMRAIAKQFATGLRLAASLNEEVTFS